MEYTPFVTWFENSKDEIRQILFEAVLEESDRNEQVKTCIGNFYKKFAASETGESVNIMLEKYITGIFKDCNGKWYAKAGEADQILEQNPQKILYAGSSQNLALMWQDHFNKFVA